MDLGFIRSLLKHGGGDTWNPDVWVSARKVLK